MIHNLNNLIKKRLSNFFKFLITWGVSASVRLIRYSVIGDVRRCMYATRTKHGGCMRSSKKWSGVRRIRSNATKDLSVLL